MHMLNSFLYIYINKSTYFCIYFIYVHTCKHYNSSFNYKNHLHICSLLKKVMFVTGFNRKISPAHFPRVFSDQLICVLSTKRD